MTPTLYEQYRDSFDALGARGYTAVTEMSRRFHRVSEMARALGLKETGGAIGHWGRGQTTPTWENNKKAQDWLKANPLKASPPEPATKLPPAAPGPTMFLATCAASDAPRIQKVLAMLNCDFVEV